MTQFLADLDLVSSELSLATLSEALGRPPGASSHDIGDPRALGKVWDQTIWRLSSAAGEDASLEGHLEELSRRAQEIGLFDPSRVPDGVLRVLSIAVLFDSAMCSVSLPAALIEPFMAAGFTLEVSAYPTQFEEEPAEVAVA